MAKRVQQKADKVKRAFDLSKWDNIDISDDESTFHPNIENSFNVKINRTVRDRRDNEEEEEKKKLLADGSPEALRQLEKLERNKKWHVGNICQVAEERTIVNEYKKQAPAGASEFLPAGTDMDTLNGYHEWKDVHLELLKEFTAAGGNFTTSHKILKDKGDILLDESTITFTHTYCMLECLEMKVQNKHAAAKKCAQQSQLCSHIIELAKSFKRPPRDLLNRWFEKTGEDSNARGVYESDVDQFIEKVTLMAKDKVQRLKEEALAEEKDKEKQERWIAKKTFEEQPESVEIDESVAPQPLLKVMYTMTKEQRLECAPGGLDPVEVFEALPKEMQDAFSTQDVPALVKLQETMPIDIFGFHLTQCIKAGLWQQPAGADEDDENEEGGEKDDGPPTEDENEMENLGISLDDCVIEELPNLPEADSSK